eukprot:3962485-Amphidinium_carterae.5
MSRVKVLVEVKVLVVPLVALSRSERPDRSHCYLHCHLFESISKDSSVIVSGGVGPVTIATRHALSSVMPGSVMSPLASTVKSGGYPATVPV